MQHDLENCASRNICTPSPHLATSARASNAFNRQQRSCPCSSLCLSHSLKSRSSLTAWWASRLTSHTILSAGWRKEHQSAFCQLLVIWQSTHSTASIGAWTRHCATHHTRCSLCLNAPLEPKWLQKLLYLRRNNSTVCFILHPKANHDFSKTYITIVTSHRMSLLRAFKIVFLAQSEREKVELSHLAQHHLLWSGLDQSEASASAGSHKKSASLL